MELITASLIGFVVIMGLGQVQVTSYRLYNFIKNSDPVSGRSRISEAGFAWQTLARDVEQADRVILLDANSDGIADNIQLRIPQGTSFDSENNYRWFQYQFDKTRQQLRVYDASCTPYNIFHQIGDFRIKFLHIAKTPPSGKEPWPGVKPPQVEDNNTLIASVASTDDDEASIEGAMVMRGVAYANIHAGFSSGVWDSGSGLGSPDWDPPGLCTN